MISRARVQTNYGKQSFFRIGKLEKGEWRPRSSPHEFKIVMGFAQNKDWAKLA